MLNGREVSYDEKDVRWITRERFSVKRERERERKKKKHVKNRHQEIYWSITRVSAGLHTTTSTLIVGEQERTEQNSLPTLLSLWQRVDRKNRYKGITYTF